MTTNIESKLNADIVGVIKSFLYLNIPTTLTIDEAQFIIYVNKLKMKDLKLICKENKIKQSNGGTINKFIVRLNIVGWKLSKNIIDDYHHPLRKYIRFDGVRDECRFTNEQY